jgi:hypothetical protein
MKKFIVTTFCTLLLCSLLLITLGPTIATAQDYTHTSYLTQVVPTIDGKWTTPNEWTDGAETWIGTNVVFRSTWDTQGSDVYTRWIVEFLTDTTTDPGDLWRFCVNFGQTWSIMFEIYGHSDLTFYIVTTSSSTEMEEAFPMEWDDSLSTSPTSSTPHWILEFQIDKNSQFTLGDVWTFLLQVFDASNPGYPSWPPNVEPEVIEGYGVENSVSEAIPEGFTFTVMALLTTVSMLVGYKYFNKRKVTKTE